MITNMEFMFYILVFMNIRVAIALICNKIITHFEIEAPWFLRFHNIVSDGLFYSVFHAIAIEAILEWSVCIYLNFGNIILTTGGEILSIIISIYAAALIYIFIPVSMIYVYSRAPELLKDKKF